jgi:prepilin-type N-terminal cleavage/methylation domain-containing protein/prepilin-type processing-associated H-X9-DG protein
MNHQQSCRKRAFTLIEVLTVLVILAILSGIIFAATVSSVGNARSTSCLSNVKQVGMAVILYAGDADDKTPGETPYAPLGGRSFFITAGWAGKVQPYAHNLSMFACPDDSSTFSSQVALPGSNKISYGANQNALPKATSELTGSRTVLLFEVANSFAQLTKPDEGMTPRPTVPEKISSVGTGIKGDLLDSFIPFALSHEDIDIQYATGRLDNSENDILHDDFLADPRHRGGANYFLVDGHARWAAPTAVSAGADAKSSTNPQSLTGCFIWPATKGTDMPCAEGTANTKHLFTFSSN